MTEPTLAEALEIRLMHLELSVENLTRMALEQDHTIAEQMKKIRELEYQLRSLTPSPVADPSEEIPPPHY